MFRALILLMALAAGGLAAWMVLAMQPNDAPATAVVQPAPQALRQEVLVAAADLGRGQVLGADSMRWQTWPEGAVNPAFITRAARPDAPETLKGSVLHDDMLSGEPIREDRLIRPDAGFLSAILPSGKRAVAVRVSAQTTAGGFILPQDHVDVIHTVSREDAAGRTRNMSVTLLSNVRVLAIDQMVDDLGAGTVIGQTATLELTPRQAEIITAAEASGMLSLALRSVQDAAEEPQQYQPQAQAQAVQPQQQAGGFVRIMRAERSELVELR